MAANPYVALALRAEQSGEFLFVWEDYEKTLATVRKTLTVVG